MKKVNRTIKLTAEQSEGYPVSTESLWFLEDGSYLRLINIPFFIDDISMEDVLELKPIGEDLFAIKRVAKRSGNSTIWVSLNVDDKGKERLEAIHALGCGYEGGVLNAYYAINVPSAVDIEKVFKILTSAENDEVLIFDCPCVQHKVKH